MKSERRERKYGREQTKNKHFVLSRQFKLCEFRPVVPNKLS